MYVRMFTPGKNGMAGRWITTAEEVIGLSPDQLKAKFALPEAPSHIADVAVPEGTLARVGRAGGNSFGKGGGLQVELLDGVDEAAFANARSLESGGR